MGKSIDFLFVYPNPCSDSPLKLAPLSILYAGAYFKRRGISVDYLDLRFDSENEFWDKVDCCKEVGFSICTGPQCGQAARLLKQVRDRYPDVITSVGGRHAQILADEIGKEPFVDLVYDSNYGDDLFPYDDQTKKHFSRTEMQYMTSTGCSFHCSFCVLSSDWVPKSAVDIDYELKTMHRDLGFKEISFSDPNIACGVQRMPLGIYRYSHDDRLSRINRIGETMRDIQVDWDGNIRADICDIPMVEALERSRCTSIEIGCESGDDNFLRNVIHKGYGVDAIKTACRNFANSGISCMYSFMHGMPGESRDSLLRTLDLIDWIHETDKHGRISIYQYSPYPGTKMYDKAVAGHDGYPRFTPPKTLAEWGDHELMKSPLYWICGMNFRRDNSRKNFPGDDWGLIRPYVDLAERKWVGRDVDEFPCEEVERLISEQQLKRAMQ